jgi:hypothetical protein
MSVTLGLYLPRRSMAMGPVPSSARKAPVLRQPNHVNRFDVNDAHGGIADEKMEPVGNVGLGQQGVTSLHNCAALRSSFRALPPL